MRFKLAKIAAWLLREFYVERGVTYTVFYGRLNPKSVKPDIRKAMAIDAHNRESYHVR